MLELKVRGDKHAGIKGGGDKHAGINLHQLTGGDKHAGIKDKGR